MSARVQVSEVIERPAADVFKFYAVDHVHSHPRWDPYIQLELITEGPLKVGSMIKRVNSRSGQPVEGTMEVVEFEPKQAMTLLIQEGPVEMRARAAFEPEGDGRTRLSLDVQMPGWDDSMDTSPVSQSMQRSLANIKSMIESEM